MNTLRALHEYQNKGYDDILWVNDSEEVTEVSTANIFFVKCENKSYKVETPEISSGMLGGITRAKLIDCLKKKGIEVTEKLIYKDDIELFGYEY